MKALSRNIKSMVEIVRFLPIYIYSYNGNYVPVELFEKDLAEYIDQEKDPWVRAMKMACLLEGLYVEQKGHCTPDVRWEFAMSYEKFERAFKTARKLYPLIRSGEREFIIRTGLFTYEEDPDDFEFARMVNVRYSLDQFMIPNYGESFITIEESV